MAEFDSEASANRITRLCERNRIARILEIGDDLDRKASARMFGFHTDLTPDEVRDLLLTTPTDAEVLRRSSAEDGNTHIGVVSS